MVFKSDEVSRPVTVLFVAAVLSDFEKKGFADFSGSFKSVMIEAFGHNSELCNGNFEAFESVLRGMSPIEDGHMKAAELIVSSHGSFYWSIGTYQTPLVIKGGSVIFDRRLMDPGHFFGESEKQK